MFTLIKTQDKARLGEFDTVHGKIMTPAFMNVATAGAIKGGLSGSDLLDIGCQVQLCNTYHLHLRPGDEVIKSLGGLRKFTVFSGPILTDSGGFQVFSLAKLRQITEKGVTFASHIDGAKIFMGPEESIKIQSNLGSTIAMAFDECVENPSTREYASLSCERTTRWLVRCQHQLKIQNAKHDTLNPKQMLFAINQGCVYPDIRVQHAKEIVKLDLDGYAIGGLAVGETTNEMYKIIEYVEPILPQNKPRYLMGVGTPANIIESVARGIDLFDCVMPSRNARHGHAFTQKGILNLNNRKYLKDQSPIELSCRCDVCKNFSRAYIRHLIRAGEVLGQRLLVMHNLYFYNKLMGEIRHAIETDSFDKFRSTQAEILSKRI